MSPFSSPVLGAATLLCAPTLYDALVTGTTSLQVAAERFGIVVVLCWLGMSAVAMLVGPAPRPPASVPPGEPGVVPGGVVPGSTVPGATAPGPDDAPGGP